MVTAQWQINVQNSKIFLLSINKNLIKIKLENIMEEKGLLQYQQKISKVLRNKFNKNYKDDFKAQLRTSKEDVNKCKVKSCF